MNFVDWIEFVTALAYLSLLRLGQSHGRGALKLPAASSFAGVSSTLTSSGDAASTSNWGSGATGYGSSGATGARFGNGGASGGAKSGDKRSVVDVVDWDSDY